jgi:ribonuclease R/exosome complex exonuclease DIS3/RRP44
MSKKGRGNKSSGSSNESAASRIKDILSNNPQQSFNYKQIAKRLNINDPSEKKAITDVLRDLTKKGIIKEAYQGKYMIKESRGYITGTVDLTRIYFDHRPRG